MGRSYGRSYNLRKQSAAMAMYQKPKHKIKMSKNKAASNHRNAKMIKLCQTKKPEPTATSESATSNDQPEAQANLSLTNSVDYNDESARSFPAIDKNFTDDPEMKSPSSTPPACQSLLEPDAAFSEAVSTEAQTEYQETPAVSDPVELDDDSARSSPAIDKNFTDDPYAPEMKSPPSTPPACISLPEPDATTAVALSTDDQMEPRATLSESDSVISADESDRSTSAIDKNYTAVPEESERESSPRTPPGNKIETAYSPVETSPSKTSILETVQQDDVQQCNILQPTSNLPSTDLVSVPDVEAVESVTLEQDKLLSTSQMILPNVITLTNPSIESVNMAANKVVQEVNLPTPEPDNMQNVVQTISTEVDLFPLNITNCQTSTILPYAGSEKLLLNNEGEKFLTKNTSLNSAPVEINTPLSSTNSTFILFSNGEPIKTIFASDHVRQVLRDSGVSTEMSGLVETFSRTARSLDENCALRNTEICVAAGIEDDITLTSVSTVVALGEGVMKPLFYDEVMLNLANDLNNDLNDLLALQQEIDIPEIEVSTSGDSTPTSPRTTRSSIVTPNSTLQSDKYCPSTATSLVNDQRDHQSTTPDDSDVDPDYVESDSSDSDDSVVDSDEVLVKRLKPDQVKSNAPSTSRMASSDTSPKPVKSKSMYEEIQVSTCTSKPEKRSYNRVNWCFYCQKKNSHIARHLRKMHRDEPAVKAIISKAETMPVKQHFLLFEKLRKEGDSKHNQDVLRERAGVLRPGRRSRLPTRAEDYVVCVYCKAWVRKLKLFIHLKTCKLRYREEGKEKVHARYAATSAYVVTHSQVDVTDEFRKTILERMTCDAIYEAIINDHLIVRFGSFLFNNLEGVNTRNQQTRNNMREVGRLLVTAKQYDSTLRNFTQLFSVKKWDIIVKAVISLTKMEAGISHTATPSLAIKLGYHLQKMANIILGDALRLSDEDLEKRIRAFMQLRDLQWFNLVVKKARRNLQRKKLNKKDVLPLTEDLQIMSRFIRKNLDEILEKFDQNTADMTDWIYFSRLLLVKCVMFNYKRVGEMSNFELSEYAQRTKGELRADVAASLTKTELFLANHMTRVETVGKCNKNIPVLLTEYMVTCIDKLLETRESVGNVPDTNIYIFANPQAYTTGCINGYDSFRQLARDSGAKRPDLIRSTKLRHHIATTSQLFDLEHFELEQLANFMGHTLDIHRNYYRLPESTLQVAKISLLLHALDKNDMSNLTGKSLGEIDLNDLLPDESDDESGSDDGGGDGPVNDVDMFEPTEPQASTSSATPQYEEIRQKPSAAIGRNRKDRDATPSSSGPSETQIDQPKRFKSADSSGQGSKGTSGARRNRDNYTVWSKEEVAAIERGFGANFISLVRPKKPDLDAFMKNEALAMKRRTFEIVRAYVQTKISGLKRRQKQAE